MKLLLALGLTLLALASSASAQPLRVLQFNVWQEGTSVEGGLEKIATVILQSQADVVAFSEVRNYRGEDWHAKLLWTLKRQAPEIEFFGHYIGGDVGLISRLPIASTATVFDETNADCGSIMAYRLACPGGREVTVCSAHLDYKHYALNWVRGYQGGAPDWNMIDTDGDGAPDRRQDAAAILEYNRQSRRAAAIDAFGAFAQAERDAGRGVILAGDFNEGSHLDWTEKAKDFAGHYGTVLPWDNSRILAEAGFRDAWRVVFPDEVANPGFTWPAPAFKRNTTSWTPLSDERDRIDFIYATSDLRPTHAWIVGPRACFIGDEQVADPGADAYLCSDLDWPSDHKGVMVEFVDEAPAP